MGQSFYPDIASDRTTQRQLGGKNVPSHSADAGVRSGRFLDLAACGGRSRLCGRRCVVLMDE